MADINSKQCCEEFVQPPKKINFEIRDSRLKFQCSISVAVN